MASDERPGQTKIGISNNPEQRAKDISKQYDLKHVAVMRMFWFPNRKAALEWEQKLLRFIKRKEVEDARFWNPKAGYFESQLRGEWVRGTPENVLWHLYELTKITRMARDVSMRRYDDAARKLPEFLGFPRRARVPIGKEWRKNVAEWGLGGTGRKRRAKPG
jgi:hypothetical protein